MIIIVLPAYNEQEAINPLCQRIKNLFSQYQIPYQIIVIDDGSTDKTASIVKGLSSELPLYLISHTHNKGLNEAIKTGLTYSVKHSRPFDTIIVMDADNTHAPGLILRMSQLIQEGYDVVIASRYLPGSRIIGVPFIRQLLSLLGSFCFRIRFPILGVKDYTCGYRAYTASILRQAFNTYGTTFINQPGFSCMVDILLKLRSMRAIMTEVPLILRYDLKPSQSKMKIYKTIKESLLLLINFRSSGPVLLKPNTI